MKGLYGFSAFRYIGCYDIFNFTIQQAGPMVDFLLDFLTGVFMHNMGIVFIVFTFRSLF